MYKKREKIKIPLMGLGTWKSNNEKELYFIIKKAIEIGYRHFDCAFIYQNESIIGKALQDSLLNNEIKRQDLFITSKLWNTSHKKDQVRQALEKSLENLNLDYLDAYLMHWPVAAYENGLYTL